MIADADHVLEDGGREGGARDGKVSFEEFHHLAHAGHHLNTFSLWKELRLADAKLEAIFRTIDRDNVCAVLSIYCIHI